MANNKAFNKAVEDNLIKIANTAQQYRKSELEFDLSLIGPKDRILFFLKMTELVLNNRDAIKSNTKKTEEKIFIEYIDLKK